LGIRLSSRWWLWVSRTHYGSLGLMPLEGPLLRTSWLVKAVMGEVYGSFSSHSSNLSVDQSGDSRLQMLQHRLWPKD